jgi:hypothetical protein
MYLKCNWKLSVGFGRALWTLIIAFIKQKVSIGLVEACRLSKSIYLDLFGGLKLSKGGDEFNNPGSIL